MKERFSRTTILTTGIYQMLGVIILSVLIAFVYRLVFLFCYADFSGLQDFKSDVLFAFVQGCRFDMKIMITFLIPILSFVLLETVFKYPLFNKLARIYATIVIIISSLLLVGDFFYYDFFSAHYDYRVFGIIDDNPEGAIFKSMWNDFPAIRILLFGFALSVLLLYAVKFIYRLRLISHIGEKKWGKYSLIVVFPLLFLAVRGNLAGFPLRHQDAFFSKNTFVNNLAQNGVFALNKAFSNYMENQFDVDVEKMLTDAGFTSDKQLVSNFLDIPVDSITIDPLLMLLRQTKADTFLIKNPPHVVVIQTEGLGFNMMNLHKEGFNILGNLAKELQHCIVFSRFLSSFEGTIYTLENILTGTVISPLSESTYVDRLSFISAVTPFKTAGYESSFVTGCLKAWRNIDVFMDNLGFDNFEGMETILHDIPDAVRQEEWGVFDEYLFQQIKNRLERSATPQLIYGMTITNHTPHEVPSTYHITDLTVDEDIKRRLVKNDRGIDCFRTYRYTCDYLGKFIQDIRNSPLAENTIIAVTGDHSIKNFIGSKDHDFLDKHGVPFILYVPQAYLKDDVVINDLNWGSHKDIFPTLFHLSLSSAKYLPFGINLLSSDANNNVGINFEVGIFGHEGAVVDHQLYKRSGNGEVFEPADDDNLQEKLQNMYNLWETISKYVILRSCN